MVAKRVNVLWAILGVVGGMALGAWYMGSRIQSPAEMAARTAAPEASPILVPVELRVLSSDVVTRGTVRFGLPQPISIAPSTVKGAVGLISSLPRPNTNFGEGEVILSASGRPVFVLSGAAPAFRDMAPGTSGGDVRQLEEALARLGFDPGTVDGNYDQKTSGAVERMYKKAGWDPFAPTREQRAAVAALEREWSDAARAQLAAEATRETAVKAVAAARATAEQNTRQAALDSAARVAGRFDKLIEDVTTNPAMLIWLSGIYNTKWDPNENYGGSSWSSLRSGSPTSSGYPYSEDDVREQARALTGWRANWMEDVGYQNFRFDRECHDSGHEDHLRSVRQVRLAGLVSPLSRARGTRAVPDRKALELLHPDAPRRVYPRRARVDVPLELRDQAAARGHPQAPRLLRGPFDGEAADRLHRGHVAGAWDGHSRGQLVVDLRHGGAASRSARRTSRGGTRSDGSTPRVTAAAGSRSRTSPARTSFRMTSPTRRTRRPRRRSTRRFAGGAGR